MTRYVNLAHWRKITARAKNVIKLS